jgi:hypothetical protein
MRCMLTLAYCRLVGCSGLAAAATTLVQPTTPSGTLFAAASTQGFATATCDCRWPATAAAALATAQAATA